MAAGKPQPEIDVQPCRQRDQQQAVAKRHREPKDEMAEEDRQSLTSDREPTQAHNSLQAQAAIVGWDKTIRKEVSE